MTAYYLGIDVSKGYADFTILDRHKQAVESNFRLDDTFAGHAGLYSVLAKFVEQHPESELFAGLESTGGYENNWLGSLRRYQASLPLQVARLNPAGVHAYNRANLKQVKTDALSAVYFLPLLAIFADRFGSGRREAICESFGRFSF